MKPQPARRTDVTKAWEAGDLVTTTTSRARTIAHPSWHDDDDDERNEDSGGKGREKAAVSYFRAQLATTRWRESISERREA